MQILTRRMERRATLDEHRAWLQALTNRSPWGPGPIPEPTDVDQTAPPSIAYVNHGRWVADCPERCGGAMVVEPGEPFLCGNCFNSAFGYRWRRVQWPPQRVAIEMVLARRPHPQNMNWFPHESVADLRRENIAHGDKG